MNKYGTIKSCPKCGEKDIHTLHVPKEEKIIPYGDNVKTITREEYMQRECTHCHYITKEAPLDSKKDK